MSHGHPFPLIQLFGLPFVRSTLEAVVHYILQTAQDGSGPRRLGVVNIPLVVRAQQDPHVLNLLQTSFFNVPDGTPIVWIGRWKGYRDMHKIRGPSLMAEVLRESANQPIAHYFCGGLPGVAETLAQAVQERFGPVRIVGTYSPPFREMSEQEIQELAREMDQAGAHIVWVGIGSPKQDRLAERLRRHTRRVGFFIPVGGAFDMLSGRFPEAPRWMQNIGMEWFFRFLQEPRRLGPRYAYALPFFLWYTLRELFRSHPPEGN